MIDSGYDSINPVAVEHRFGLRASDLAFSHLRSLRSLMFTPGQREAMVTKALTLPLDAVILDIEDGVPFGQKDLAAATIARALRERMAGADRPASLVRINAIGSGRAFIDLDSVVGSGLDGVLIPKVEAPGEIWLVEGALSVLEHQRDLPSQSTAIVVAFESAKGLTRAEEILTSSRRIVGAMFGAEDYALDLGLPVRRGSLGQQLLYARSSLVSAATVARTSAYDQVWLNFHDQEGLRSEAVEGKDLGFTGKCLIHPSQIQTVNHVFSPSDEDVETARTIVEAFEAASAEGIGAVMLGGQLVELPIVERAQRTLTTYEDLQRMSS